MDIILDRDSGIALYRQLEHWFSQAIVSGSLVPGTRLPASRALAASLGLSRTTVDAAYAEMIACGIVETRGSGGTVVARIAASIPDADARSGKARAAPVPPASRLHLIDFSGGGGDDSLFPFASFLRQLKSRHGRDPGGVLGLPDPDGEPALRESIARICASQGLLLPREGILVTGGSQQAIALCSAALAQAGDAVLVEEPSYAKAIALFRAQGLQVIPISCDQQGPDPAAFENLARRHHARFAYLMPNFRNPTGSCMSASRRHAIAAAADRMELPILEDDYAGGLRYEGASLPSLKNLCRPGNVIHTSTFSKMLAPGLCIGYLAAEGQVLDRLRELKHLAGLSASRLFQRGLTDFINVGSYRSHQRRAIKLCRRRRDALCHALAHHLPEAEFSCPAGGLFLWVRLPGKACPEDFWRRCDELGVKISDGRDCFVQPPAGSRHIRLNFCQVDDPAIEPGIIRLAQALRK